MSKQDVLNPAVFVTGDIKLWQNLNESDRSPIMYGVVNIPKRVFDFAWNNSKRYYIKGEPCVQISVVLWEDHGSPYFTANPPLYNGVSQLYLTGIEDDELRDRIKRAKAYNNNKRIR